MLCHQPMLKFVKGCGGGREWSALQIRQTCVLSPVHLCFLGPPCALLDARTAAHIIKVTSTTPDPFSSFPLTTPLPLPSLPALVLIYAPFLDSTRTRILLHLVCTAQVAAPLMVRTANRGGGSPRHRAGAVSGSSGGGPVEAAPSPAPASEALAPPHEAAGVSAGGGEGAEGGAGGKGSEETASVGGQQSPSSLRVPAMQPTGPAPSVSVPQGSRKRGAAQGRGVSSLSLFAPLPSPQQGAPSAQELGYGNSRLAALPQEELAWLNILTQTDRWFKVSDYPSHHMNACTIAWTISRCYNSCLWNTASEHTRPLFHAHFP